MHLWKGYEHSFRPNEFKDSLGNVIHRFSSFSQQDSHEFLSLFLDNLHEDLNRISNKPYIDLEEQKKDETDEQASQRWWSNHKKREDSIISDLFHGQLKSKIDCPDCKRTSITYDPFMFLVLSLNEPEPDEELTYKYFYFDTTFKILKCQIISIQLTYTLKVKDLLDKVKQNAYIDSPYGYEVVILDHEKMILCKLPEEFVIYAFVKKNYEICIYNKEHEVFDNIYIYPMTKKYFLSFIPNGIEYISYPFSMSGDNNKLISDIKKECQLRLNHCLYKTDIIFKGIHSQCIFNVNNKGTITRNDYFKCMFCNRVFQTNQYFDDSDKHCDIRDSDLMDFIRQQNTLNQMIIICAFITYNESLVHENLKNKLKDHMSINIVKQIPRNINNNKHNLDIYEAINKFLEKEKLNKDNAWYCNVCKEHKEAIKKIDIYKTPKYLIVQLKRFKMSCGYYMMNNNQKIETFVDFPINGFDLSKYVIGDKGNGIYDLYGIVNHYGNLEMGHYVAVCKNGNKWWEFNDECVKCISDESDIVTRAAYLLFYKMRDTEN
jgi:ubiquitin carboxyl-terminal hydrolase 4/11/15